MKPLFNAIGMALPTIMLAMALLVFLAGCGTTTGNELVQSSAFTSGSSLTHLADAINLTATVPVTDFKICVGMMQILDSNGNPQSVNGNSEITFAPGLIDLSSGAALTWGTAGIPVGFQMATILLHAKQDTGECQVSYAFDFNGVNTQQETVLTFSVNPPVSVDLNGGTLTLTLDALVTSLQTQAATGALTPSNIKSQVQTVVNAAVHQRPARDSQPDDKTKSSQGDSGNKGQNGSGQHGHGQNKPGH